MQHKTYRRVLAFALAAASLSAFAPTALAEGVEENGYTSTREFIDLNLYDYNEKINERWKADKKYPGFQWNGGAYEGSRGTGLYIVDAIDFGNSKITDYAYSGKNHGKSSTSTAVGNAGGDINRLDTSAGVTNRPIGMSTGRQALANSLQDGYPALKDGTSLAWLFTENEAVDKLNTGSIDGLFKQDAETGAYSYNSRENHAQYGDDMFTRYNAILTPNFIIYPFGNFLPFNDITDSGGATNVGGIENTGAYIDAVRSQLGSSRTDAQLDYMLGEYQSALNKAGLGSAAAGDVLRDYISSGKNDSPGGTVDIPDGYLDSMYNIDWDVETNFFFGMDMSMNFMMPKEGLTGRDGDAPMVFSFTGDDDVWVYVDGALFLDLSGIHRHVGGKIDFVNGMVYYYALDEKSGDVSMDTETAGGEGAYAAYSFSELLSAAGKDTSVLNGKGTFKDYSSHEFKFYYMERGSGSSVCRISFNFPLLRKDSIAVEKEVLAEGELPEDMAYSFQILKAESEELFIGPDAAYSVYSENGELLREELTDARGVFMLKPGERAEFEGIAENAGSYYVRELLTQDAGLYHSGVEINGETVRPKAMELNGVSFQALDSPVMDAYGGAAVFHFLDRVDITKLPQTGSLDGELPPDETSGAEDNDACLSTISIPALGLELPVWGRWSYEKLEQAPCRYSGSVGGGDLVLLAHNYERHFAGIDELQQGDEIIITDAEGQELHYRVSGHEVLEAWERERLCSGEYELSLFTCTDDGTQRHVLRCKKI